MIGTDADEFSELQKTLTAAYEAVRQAENQVEQYRADFDGAQLRISRLLESVKRSSWEVTQDYCITDECNRLGDFAAQLAQTAATLQRIEAQLYQASLAMEATEAAWFDAKKGVFEFATACVAKYEGASTRLAAHWASVAAAHTDDLEQMAHFTEVARIALQFACE